MLCIFKKQQQLNIQLTLISVQICHSEHSPLIDQIHITFTAKEHLSLYNIVIENHQE